MTDLSAECVGYRRIFIEINCPICLEKKQNGYASVCGHPVCIECFGNLEKKSMCPSCQQQFIQIVPQSNTIIPVRNILPPMTEEEIAASRAARIRSMMEERKNLMIMRYIVCAGLAFVAATSLLITAGVGFERDKAKFNMYCGNPVINQTCGDFIFARAEYMYSTFGEVSQSYLGVITYGTNFYFAIIPNNTILQCDRVQSTNYVAVHDAANSTYAKDQMVPVYLNGGGCMIFNRDNMIDNYNNALNAYNTDIRMLIAGGVLFIAVMFPFIFCAIRTAQT